MQCLPQGESSVTAAVDNFHDSSLAHFPCPPGSRQICQDPSSPNLPHFAHSNPRFYGLKSCWGIFLRDPSLPGWAEDYKVWLRVSRSNLVLPMKIKDGSTLRCQVNTVWWSISRLHILEDCKSLIDLGKLYLGERIRQRSSMDQNCLGGSLPREQQCPLNDCFPFNNLEINCTSYINFTRMGHLFWLESAPYFTLNEKAYPLKAKFCILLNYCKMTQRRINFPSSISADFRYVWTHFALCPYWWSVSNYSKGCFDAFKSQPVIQLAESKVCACAPRKKALFWWALILGRNAILLWKR